MITFIGTLWALVLLNAGVSYLLWRHRPSELKALLLLLWSSWFGWFWGVAPLLHLFSIPLQGAQWLAAAHLLIFYVPLSGVGALALAALYARSVLAPKAPIVSIEGAREQYVRAVHLPTVSAVVVWACAAASYLGAVLALGIFAGFSYQLCAVLLLQGAVLAFLFSAILGTVFDRVLSPARQKLEGRYYETHHAPRKLRGQLLGVVTRGVCATVGALYLFVFLPGLPLFTGLGVSACILLCGLVPVWLSVSRVANSVESLMERAASAKESTDGATASSDELEELSHAMAVLHRSTQQVAVQSWSTAEKRAEELKGQRALYERMLASVGDGIVVADLERKVTVVNHAAEKILGYGASELIGKPIHEVLQFVLKNDGPFDTNLWERLYTGTEVEILPDDISVLTKNKEAVAVIATTAPILNPNKERSGVIVAMHDMHEQRALEETRASFISVASHQLRTPLTSMRWFSEMLLSGDAGEITKEQKVFVDHIYEGTTRMIDLVNLLLQIARVEQRRVRIDPKPINLKALTRDVVLSIKNNLNVKSQQVLIESEPQEFPELMLDKEIVWQVIQNLLSNAVRYSPEQANITVHMGITGESVTYAVIDQGIGIPEEDKGKIFEKFYRAPNALRYVPEGSGLGLSLVKSLVEGWGGTMTFVSTEGKGTTFTFTLPLAGMTKREGDVGITV